MSISFQTNVASMIAAVNLNNNNNFQTNTIEQLTSGYRINSSGDDAAGLAVANGYAASVAELNQGVLNANEGVNTLQIIDGGLSNISTMLNRMQTLATESASGTFTGNRATLDAEYQTLIGEINREASNIGLSSTNQANATNMSVYVGGGQSATTGSQVSVNLANGLVDATGLGLTGTNVAATAPTVMSGATAATFLGTGASQTFTINTGSGTAGSVTISNNGAGDTLAAQIGRLNTALSSYGISASLSTAAATAGQLQLSGNAAFDVVAAAAGGGTGALAATAAEAKNLSLYNFAMTSSAGNFTITEGAGASLKTATVTLLGVGNDPANLSTINTELAAVGITDVTAVATGTAGTYSLQGSGAAFKASATAGAAVTAATAPATGGGSLAAINQISAAVQALGTVQGSVGAGENDLNYAIGLANSQITNFSASESSIRDANVATEAANLTKAQVLEQASVAAMAQANSAPQAILSLLKS